MLSITTVILILVVIFSGISATFPLVFILVAMGALLFIFSVYFILKDDYTTEKTFDDFYEDYPISKQE